MEHTLTKSEAHTNVEIQGTLSNVADDALNNKVINIFHLLNINVNKDDIEDCHRLEKQIQFYDLLTRSNGTICLRKVDSAKLDFQAGAVGNSKEQAKFTVVGVPRGL